MMRNFAWGEKKTGAGEETPPDRVREEPARASPPRRLPVTPLEDRIAPNVAWGE